MRCYQDEAIEVRRRGDIPSQFLWRRRLYLVREVLATWSEAARWWLAPAARQLLEEGSPAAPDAGSAVPLEVGDRQFWRVEAAPGQAASSGVFDLCFDWGRGQWLLAAVLD